MERMESPNSALAIPGPVLTPAQQNQENMNKLESAVTELLVSSYDPVVGKTIWQCAQCHFSSKVRYTVKQHIETHLAGFTHQCPSCEKTCKTRNALRAHVMRAHTDRPPSSNQNQNWQMQSNSNQSSPVMSPDGFMQVQFHEMGEPMMKKPRRPRQARPHDEELERQIRMLLVSNFDEEECKTTWSCAQCNYSNKLQYTVKQHIETHITSIVHQCTQCDKILKTRNALRAHMIQKHEPKMMQSPQWMGGGNQSNYSSPSHSPAPQNPMGGGGGGGGMQFQPQQQQQQQQQQHQQEYRPRKKRAEVIRKVPTEMDLELDRQVAELMVSNYDASVGKTSWQCAQCHFTSKIRSTVKEHIETHITGFVHQCPYCEKTCKTRNALRVHTVRAHNKHHLENQARANPIVNSAPKICYEPQPQQQNSHSQQSSHQNNPQNNPQNSQQQQSMQPVVAKRTVQTPDPPKPVMYQPEPPKQPEVPRQGIMNHPMIGRPMYGHPMMMGHPMI